MSAISKIKPSEATILVVDDIVANRNLLREILEPAGYEVLLAPDGGAALKIATRARPDLILLDVMMPKLDGFQTCRHLKGQDSTARSKRKFGAARKRKHPSRKQTSSSVCCRSAKLSGGALAILSARASG